MRLDSAGPRTWLLVVVVGWALLAGLLALAGMGSRIEPLPEDPELLEPLPPLRPAPPLRLGPIEQYAVVSQRPLFAEDRRPHPFFLEGQGTAAEDNAFDYVLSSVLITPQLKMAILQPREPEPGGDGRSVRVRLDEAPATHPAWRLVELSPRSAVFAGPEGQRTLELRVYDGTGGAPPTLVSMAPRTADGFDPDAPMAPPPPDDGAGEASGPDPVPRPTPAEPPAPEPVPAEEMSEPAQARPSPPMTEEAQMQAIRQRIQARREQMRRESSQPPDPNR
jgi:general secretion pathway protein N